MILVKRALFLVLALHLFPALSQSHLGDVLLSLRVNTQVELVQHLMKITESLPQDESKQNMVIDQIIDNALEYVLNHPQFKRSPGKYTKDFFHKIKNETRYLARTKGITAAIVFVTFELAEIPLRVLFIGIGHPELVLLMELTRLEFTLTLGFLQAKKNIDNYKFKKYFADDISYREYKKDRKYFLKDHKLKNEEGVLYQGGIYVYALNNQNIFHRMLTAVHLIRSLNAKNLKRFLKDEGLYNNELHRIFIDRDLIEQEKIVLVLRILEELKDDELLQRLALRFAKQSSEEKMQQFNSAVYQWAKNLSAVTSYGELRLNFLNYPKDCHPAILIQVWEHAVLPHLAHHSEDFKYRTFRRLYKELEVLSAQSKRLAITGQAVNWPEWHQLFINYLD
jgi:hypothetical protein